MAYGMRLKPVNFVNTGEGMEQNQRNIDEDCIQSLGKIRDFYYNF